MIDLLVRQDLAEAMAHTRQSRVIHLLVRQDLAAATHAAKARAVSRARQRDSTPPMTRVRAALPAAYSPHRRTTLASSLPRQSIPARATTRLLRPASRMQSRHLSQGEGVLSGQEGGRQGGPYMVWLPC